MMGPEMPHQRQFDRIDVVEIKMRLFKRLGRQKAEKYLQHLKRLLSMKLSKREFDKLCCLTIGKENIPLHNLLIRSILANAFLSTGPASKRAATGHSGTNRVAPSMLPAFRARSDVGLDSKCKDPPSLHEKVVTSGEAHEVVESCCLQEAKQGAPGLRSNGSKVPLEVLSVEDGEEVEQAQASPYVQSRSPIAGPFGTQGARLRPSRRALGSYVPFSCYADGHLPDTESFHKDLQRRVESEGLAVSAECADALNRGLNAYLRSLIEPCINLAKARRANGKTSHFASMNGVWQYNHVLQGSNQHYHCSMEDFVVSVDTNPRLLGTGWPIKSAKVVQYNWGND